jgi:hypothetical protein
MVWVSLGLGEAVGVGGIFVAVTGMGVCVDVRTCITVVGSPWQATSAGMRAKNPMRRKNFADKEYCINQ